MLLKKIKLPEKQCRHITFSYDGLLLASVSQKKIIVWNIYCSQQIKKFTVNKYYFSDVALSNDRKSIVTVDSCETIKLYALYSGREILSLEEKNIFNIAISCQSKLIAISNYKNHQIKLLDITSNQICIFEDYKHSKSRVAFSHNSQILALGDPFSGTVGLLSIASKKLTHLLEGMVSNGGLVFSADGKMIAGESYCFDAVILFDVNSGKQLRILRERNNFHNSEITCIAFSSDSRLVASASYDMTIRIWDVDTGKQIKKIEGHETTISNLLFTNKDRTLISASLDGIICFWQI